MTAAPSYRQEYNRNLAQCWIRAEDSRNRPVVAVLYEGFTIVYARLCADPALPRGTPGWFVAMQVDAGRSATGWGWRYEVGEETVAITALVPSPRLVTLTTGLGVPDCLSEVWMDGAWTLPARRFTSEALTGLGTALAEEDRRRRAR